MRLDGHRQRNLTKLDSLKIDLTGQEGPNSPKSEVIGVLTKILSIQLYFLYFNDKDLVYSIIFFILQYESTNDVLTLCKN